MGNIMINYLFITVVAIICFLTIRSFSKQNILSKRSYKILISVGPLSWISQMLILQQAAPEAWLLISLVIAIAAICFMVLMSLAFDERISGKSTAQAVLWGELVFPLVLISLLPNGAWTIIDRI